MKSISGKNWEEIKLNKRLIEKTKIDHNLNDIQSTAFRESRKQNFGIFKRFLRL